MKKFIEQTDEHMYVRRYREWTCRDTEYEKLAQSSVDCTGQLPLSTSCRNSWMGMVYDILNEYILLSSPTCGQLKVLQGLSRKVTCALHVV